MTASRLGRVLGRLRRDERGSTLPLFGLGLLMVFGFGALAVDGSMLYATKNALQVAADAAALAAARDLPDPGAAAATARRVARSNLPAERHGEVLRADDVEVGFWDRERQAFALDGDGLRAVRVTTRRAAANGNPQATFLAGVLGVDRVDMSAVAIALNRPPAPICILALHPSRSAAMRVWGSAQVVADDCVIQVNSDAGDALTVGGSGSVAALRTLVHGGVSGTRITPAAETGMPVVPDPLAALPAPPSGACARSNEIRGSRNAETPVSPGTYCGGLYVRSNTNAVFRPGVYVIDGGPFEVDGNAGATARGEGVLFYLKGPGARLNITGGPTIDLRAATVGTYAGVLFFAERGRSNVTHRMRGNAGMRIEGVLYAPSDHLDYSGTSDSAITIMIADTIEYQGNSSFRRDTDRTNVPLPTGIAEMKGASSIVQ